MICNYDWSSFYINSVVTRYVGDAGYDWTGVLLQFYVESVFLSKGLFYENKFPNLFLDFS